MPIAGTPEARATATKASRTRHHPDQPELVAEAASELARLRLGKAIDAIVADAPELTPGQSARLRRLLSNTEA